MQYWYPTHSQAMFHHWFNHAVPDRCLLSRWSCHHLGGYDETGAHPEQAVGWSLQQDQKNCEQKVISCGGFCFGASPRIVQNPELQHSRGKQAGGNKTSDNHSTFTYHLLCPSLIWMCCAIWQAAIKPDWWWSTIGLRLKISITNTASLNPTGESKTSAMLRAWLRIQSAWGANRLLWRRKCRCNTQDGWSSLMALLMTTFGAHANSCWTGLKENKQNKPRLEETFVIQLFEDWFL